MAQHDLIDFYLRSDPFGLISPLFLFRLIISSIYVQTKLIHLVALEVKYCTAAVLIDAVSIKPIKAFSDSNKSFHDFLSSSVILNLKQVINSDIKRQT